MKFFNKIIYSCIYALASLLYNPEKAFGGTITYTCNIHGNTVYYLDTTCPGSYSSQYLYFRGPPLMNELFSSVTFLTSTLCDAGEYIAACSLSSADILIEESNWEQGCTHGRVICGTCPNSGQSAESIEEYCSMDSASVTFVICSTLHLKTDGSVGIHGQNRMDTWTCVANCVDSGATVSRKSDCYIAAGGLISDETGTFSCTADAYYGE